jgi:pyruvate kinase
MNGARLNFSHATHDIHLQTIEHIKSVRDELNISLAIILDTKGPEIRTANVPSDGLSIEPGFQFSVFKESKHIGANAITFDPESIIDHLNEGDNVLIDDGYINCQVVKKMSDHVILEAQNFGVVKNKKGVNLPGKALPFPDITDRDAEDIRFGCIHGVDVIAASFICIPEQVIAIKKLLRDLGSSDIQIFAKIESQQAVDNFDQILQVADGIMVARGDLGVEMPIASVPRIQKQVIKKCGEHAKPVIVATQMLESMINCPRPTRAEVSDVANAIYDSASGVMLSAETAAGRYPILTVKMMDEIVRDAEADVDSYTQFYTKEERVKFYNIPAALAQAAVTTCVHANAKGIVVFSKSGNTARLISRSRPRLPIVVVTPNRKTYHQLAICWGAHAVIERIDENIKGNLDFISCYLIQHKLLEYGDFVVITLGTPYGISHTTNTITVDSIGSVIARGVPARSHPESHFIYAKRRILLDSDIKKEGDYRGEILVLTELKKEYLPLLTGAKALILQNSTEDFVSEKLAREYAEKNDFPCIIRADSASSLLEEDQWISIREDKGLIFRGDAAKEKEMIEKSSIVV